ncbi:hypothetical protein C5B26_06575, partial [Neisseria gonorrhoeae]
MAFLRQHGNQIVGNDIRTKRNKRIGANIDDDIMDEKVKAILATIVEKNGIALSPKDPIMVVFTALEYMLSEQ